MSSSTSSSSFINTSVMDLSTDEVLSSSSSESEMEDEVFRPNDYQFDGVDPMVIPPPIRRAPIPQVPAATGETSGGGGVMMLAVAAAAASPMSSSVGGDAASDTT